MTTMFVSTDSPEITAEVHSDDYAFEVSFEANRWFASASPDQICKLAKAGWGGDEPADRVALESAAFNEEIKALYTYLDLKKSVQLDRETVGFEVHVDEDSAREWLRVHRPYILGL
ncbi:MAG: hypothetical protein RB191_22620, partial [Terriglobia bacterium]|nr:hypothetical protein [Terriglobia bacterium]